MSYSKDLAAYPEEFGPLIEMGALEGVTLPMPSAEEAKRLQGRLYAYKGSLKKAAHEMDCPEETRALYRIAQKCQMRAEGSLLILRPMDQDPDALLIRAVLGIEGAVPPPPGGVGSRAANEGPKELPEGQVLVPINTKHLPAWLAEYATKRAEDFKG